MLNILVGQCQQIGHANGGSDPNEPGVGNLHLVGTVEQVDWDDANICGNAVENELIFLGNGRGEVL
jgi:hypothetical protein